MMWLGFETAVNELTLVAFTTLAPSGALAFILMGSLYFRCARKKREAGRLNLFLFIPLTVSMAGLVASATHLGNPTNVLYVFQGAGRSPLSNEVLSAALFLFLAGTYWLYSFTVKPNRTFQAIWFVATAAVGTCFIASVGFAYSARTVVTWNTVFTPLSICLNSLVGGPLLALASVHLAGQPEMSNAMIKTASVASGIAAALNVVVMVVQNSEMKGVSNSYAAASELVPFYGIVIVVFSVLVILALALTLMTVLGDGAKLRTAFLVSAVILAFAAIFITRFVFYMMRLTV